MGKRQRRREREDTERKLPQESRDRFFDRLVEHLNQSPQGWKDLKINGPTV